MPAGNDAAAAAAELADQFSAGQAKAEDLRDANRARYSEQLRAAQMLERDEERTATVDWDKAAEAVDVDTESVIDVAVRGDNVIVVSEDARGEAHKFVCDAEDCGVEVKRTGAARRRRASVQAAREQQQAAADAAQAEAEKARKPAKRSRKKGSSRKKS